jgi:hypothetical protein
MLEKLDFAPYIEYNTVKDDDKRVTGVKINYVDLAKIVEAIYPLVDPKNNLKDPIIHETYRSLGEKQKLMLASQMLITRYCIHRLLIQLNLHMGDVWMYKSAFDYYGEEVQVIHLKPTLRIRLEAFLTELKNKNASEKIEMVLLLEYGRLIPAVTKKQWFVTRVHPSDLVFSNTEHYMQCKADLEKNDDYRRSLKNFPLPRGITVLNPDNNHKVIDGYHRLVGTPEGEHPLVIYCLRD